MTESEPPGLQVCDSLWKDLSPVPAADPNVFQASSWISGTSGSQVEIEHYIVQHVLKGLAPSIALLGLVLVSLSMFLSWRLLRCVFCCEPGNFHIGIYEKLTDRRLFMYKAVVTVLALSCLAPILAGMVILPGQPLQCIVNESDAFFKEVQRVVGSGEAAQMAIQDIYPALQEIRDVMHDRVDQEQIRADLSALEPFLLSLPDPRPLLENFRAMNDLMNSPGRPLPMSIGASRRVFTDLSGAVSGLDAWSADSDWLSQLSSDLSRLQDVLQSLPQPESLGREGARRELENMREAQASVQPLGYLFRIEEVLDNLSELQNSTDRQPEILGSLSPVTEARAAIRPMIRVLSAANKVDAAAAKEVLLRLSASIVDIDQNVAELQEGDEWRKDLRDATDMVDKLADMQSEQKNSTRSGDKTSETLKDLDSARLLSILENMEGLLDSLLAPDALDEVVQSTSATILQVSNSSTLEEATTMVKRVSDLLQDFAPRAANVQGITARSFDEDADLSEQYSELFERAKAVQPVTESILEELEPFPRWDDLEGSESRQSLFSRFNNFSRQIRSLDRQFSQYPQESKQQSWIDALEEAVSSFEALPEDRLEILDRPRARLQSTLSAADETLDKVEQQLDDILDEYGQYLDDFKGSVLPDVIEARDDVVAMATQYWSSAYKAWQGGYGLLILLLLLVLLTAFLSCPGGLVCSTTVLQLWLVVWMLLTVAVLAALVVLNDACTHAERIILHEAEVRADVQALPRYFLYGTGDLTAALAADALVDVEKIQADIDQSQQELTAKVTEDLRLHSDLSAAVTGLNDAVDHAQLQIDVLLQEAGREPFIQSYTNLKACLCCSLGSSLFNQWLCVTISGLLAYLTAMASIAVTRRFDDLPCGSCTGCHIYKASQYKAAETLPPTPLSTLSSTLSTWWGGMLLKRKQSPQFSSSSNRSSSASLSSLSPMSSRRNTTVASVNVQPPQPPHPPARL